MRGSDVHQPGLWSTFDSSFYNQPFFINRYRNYFRTDSEKSASRAGVARIFQPNWVASIDQHPRGKIDALLRTRQKNDLFKRAMGPTGDHPLGRYCFT